MLSSAEAASATPTTEIQQGLEEHAFRYGRRYDSYHVTDPGREYFFAPDGRGVVAFARTGRCFHVGGGLLAAHSDKESLLTQFMEYARAQRCTCKFYNIADDELPLFRQNGFQGTKWGEDAIVDLEKCTWRGRAFELVRSQSNYCRRKGVAISECRRESMSSAAWQSLKQEFAEVSAEFLATKPQAREMKFFEGRFDPDCLRRKRVFIARAEGGGGRLEGFLVCNPALDGATWSFDIYRHRPDAVKGTITFLMQQAMELLRNEGVQTVSLGLLPGVRCDQPRPGDSRLVRMGIVFFHRYLNFLFDTPGLYHFKQRFRPQFENRYVCTWPRSSLGGMWSFIRLFGLLDLHPGRLVRTLFTRLRKSSARAASLTTPEDDESVPNRHPRHAA